jgi:glycosyltransferase involved in cell wall biosynthesis
MTHDRPGKLIGDRAAGTLKVSIVVATYCPGDGLERLVNSIEKQTLPSTDFEVIFVDDESPDDTWEVLGNVVREHSNMVAYQLSHSGWPSAPRNFGIDRARGEYVAFADHDDMFYPDGLRAAYDYAMLNGADILNGKETQTHITSWAVDSYRCNYPNTLGRADPHPLAPMNPHKLYRTSFLRENGIRFPEGRRSLYEDNIFNIDALSAAKVISTLADTPYYHWYRTGRRTTSATFRDDPDEFWTAIRRIIERAYEKLVSPEQAGLLDLMVLYQHRLRVVGYFSHDYSTRSKERNERAIRHIERIVAELIPERLDALLPMPHRLKAHLIREGHWAELAELSAWEPELTGTAGADALRWEGQELVVEGTMTWCDRDGNPPQLRGVGDRILRIVPAAVERVAPPELLDLTDHLDNISAELGIRSRASKEVWLARTSQSLKLVAGEDRKLDVAVNFVGRIDPETEAMGHRLSSGVWDVNALATWHRTIQQRGIGYSKAARTALLGRSAIAYSTQSKQLALDLGGTVRSLVRSGWKGTAISRQGRLIQIPLERVQVVREQDLMGFVQLTPEPGSWLRRMADRMTRIRRRRSAVVTMSAQRGPELVFVGPRAPGTYTMYVQLEGRQVELDQRLVIGRRGRVTVS